MFIIERLVNNLHDKQEAWERNCKKWIAEGENGGYNYRTRDGYATHNPRPGIDTKAIFKIVPIFLASCTLLLFIFSIIDSAVKNDKEIVNATKDGANCRMFNKDDRIKIETGDYQGLTGIIVGGCNKGEEYQIKLDAGSKANIDGDGQGDIDVSGRIIGIRSYKDLIEIKKEQ